MTEVPEQPKPIAPAAPAARSIDEIKRDPLVARACERAGDAIIGAKEFVGEISLTVDRDRIAEVAQVFKDDGFNYLVDLSGVDYSNYPSWTGDRFGVSYTLYSFSKNNRVRLKVTTDENTPIPSVTSVWKTANWHERETFDMLGIVFEGHPNLERILMWEGFNGHPLRKDFPIRGIDTGARIYPEVFPEGGGPRAGSTGKDVKDVNIYKGEWTHYGTWPVAEIAARAAEGGQAPAPELAGVVADTAQPTEDAPWHDPEKALPERMELAKEGSLKDKLFAAMAQTDCTACGWDCEGYAAALASGETNDITLCVPGEDETESMLKQLMAGKP
ncbi:MAG TPA: NADH-quinone oxidoreductase subunit C [Thermoanaerobaculia bacterium]|jgi:NADH-quinone oxidoreductase subunit C|nr:NADH-quinone oxidoreductase subunit C [Thermoanaerobaculia bacterium]